MSLARLVVTAVVHQRRPVSEVARTYGVHRSWIYKLLKRYKEEGESAFEPHSRRPHTSPRAISKDTVAAILTLRAKLTEAGHDAGPETIAYHLSQQGITVSVTTVWRTLDREGLITPEPKKRPKSSWIRFEADQPNECWQTDFTHCPLADGSDVEVLTFLDDHSRYALSVTAHRVVTGTTVTSTFTATTASFGIPASVLSDNGLVYTTRSLGARNHFEPPWIFRRVVGYATSGSGVTVVACR